MRFLLSLLAILTSGLSACGLVGGIATSSYSYIPESCFSLQKRAGDREFTALLAGECRQAAKSLQDDPDAISAWYAQAYLQSLDDLEAAIITLEYEPTRAGEYLIAREVHATQALQHWIIAKRLEGQRAANPQSLPYRED
jgi:hypothetical protein